MMTRLICLATCSFMLAAHAPAVFAQDGTPAPRAVSTPIGGAWTFQSEPYRGGVCTMSGQMQIRPDEASPSYDCNFVAVEDCAGEDRWVVEQSCKAVEREGRLYIKSAITGFIEAEASTDSYLTDNFQLEIRSRSLMEGFLVSAVTAPIRFRRAVDLVS